MDTWQLSTSVVVNGRCDAACGFCHLDGRAGLDDAARFDELLGHIREQREKEANSLRITGGEPLLEARLGELIQAAAELGYKEITLETNGIRAARAGVAGALAKAGLTHVLWAVNAPAEKLADEVFRTKGAHRLSTIGARAFARAGVRVTARTPLASSNLRLLHRMPEWFAQVLPELESWWLHPLTARPGPQRPFEYLPALPDMAKAISAAVAEAGRLDLDVLIDDEAGLPWCMFKGSPDALRALSRRLRREDLGNHSKQPACDDCAVGGKCPGQPADTVGVHGPAEVFPFDRFPGALMKKSGRPEAMVIYDKHAGDFEQDLSEIRPEWVVIRVIMPCNQDCHFCFVDRTTKSLTDEQIVAAIDEAAAGKVGLMEFSGGEPTLHRNLPDFIRRAKERGVPKVGIQSNALKLTDTELCDRLVEAGLDYALVSIHAVDPDRYLRITGAGTPDQALTGVRNLLDRGIEVDISVVHNRDNLDHLTAVVETFAERIPEAQVLFSHTNIRSSIPRNWGDFAVRFSEGFPYLSAAIDRARELGFRFQVTDYCGIPPCIAKPRPDLLPLFANEGFDERGYVGRSYTAACESCAMRSRCKGVTRDYLERFGDDELSSVDAVEDEHGAAPARAG